MWRYTNTFQWHTWRLVACLVWLGKMCLQETFHLWIQLDNMRSTYRGKQIRFKSFGKTTNFWVRKWKWCSGTSFSSQETGFLTDKHFVFHVFPTIEQNNRGRQLDWWASLAGSGFPFHLSKHISNYFHHSKKWMICHSIFCTSITCFQYHSNSASI